MHATCPVRLIIPALIILFIAAGGQGFALHFSPASCCFNPLRSRYLPQLLFSDTFNPRSFIKDSVLSPYKTLATISAHNFLTWRETCWLLATKHVSRFKPLIQNFTIGIRSLTRSFNLPNSYAHLGDPKYIPSLHPSHRLYPVHFILLDVTIVTMQDVHHKYLPSLCDIHKCPLC